jgi:hypothetical protein
MRRLRELFLLVIAAGTAQGAPPLITEDTGTQGKGVAQIELTLEHPRDTRSGATYRGTETSFVLNYGVAENVDLQYVFSYLRVVDDAAGGAATVQGPLDSRLNLKWRFYERDRFSLALMPGVLLPTGKPGLSSERANPGVMLIGSYEPEPFALHADLGYRHLDNALGLREDLYHASASLHYTWHSTLRLVADYSGETRLEPGPSGWVRYSTWGVIWIFAPGFGLGCGVKLGHGEYAIERTYLCGLNARLNADPPPSQ